MKKILITGAGSGLGRGTAIGLAQAGHDVLATTRIWPQVTELRRDVANLGLEDRVTVDKLDVLDPSDVKAAAKRDFDTFVSNAGAADCGPMAEIPVELPGYTNRAVAEQLFVSPHTVNAHLRHVFAKLGVRSRAELVRLAAEREAQT